MPTCLARPVRHRAGFDDDLDTLAPEERKEILDELAAKFAASGFNLRWLVEGICLSKAYQRASLSARGRFGPTPGADASPEQVFARWISLWG